ncbi:MAG: hypothetical protein ACRCUY_03680, partial [Thermoguttaceae bacterium]
MKRIGTIATLLFVAATSGLVAAQQTKTAKDMDRNVAQKTFDQLSENAKKGLLAENPVVQSKFTAIEPVDFKDETGNVQKIDSGMRIWFEQFDAEKNAPSGKFISPGNYQFKPNERFFVHVEAAVPVYVVLYQNFPNEKEAKQVFPVEKFPSSYRVLETAKSTKLPVLFKMDGNYTNEHMGIVVARADWDGIVENVPDAAKIAVKVAQAKSEQEIAMAYNGVAKGAADISSPEVLSKFAAEIEWDDAAMGAGQDIVPQENTESAKKETVS